MSIYLPSRCDNIVGQVTKDLNDFRKEVSSELAEVHSQFVATCLELVRKQSASCGVSTFLQSCCFRDVVE
jgi:hypothetical protein